PGSGKTTLARLLAAKLKLPHVPFSAVTSGIKEVREAIGMAAARRTQDGKPTLLFVDEIHRFNRAQQDAFLPHIEDGTIILVGATTENPSFELTAPLLSRCRVLVLRPLLETEIRTILDRALKDPERGLGKRRLEVEPAALEWIARMSHGDAREALNLLDLAVSSGRVTLAAVQAAVPRLLARHDRDREQHYNIASAFIKSMRGSDPDAALYWMARLLEGGEDPLFVARRMVVFASEDVGNADPRALSVAVAAKEAVDFIGMPEAWIPLAQAVTYLATAPKSNASYVAMNEAREDVRTKPHEGVPLHLRNAPTGLMKELNYGKGYEYAHDAEGGVPGHGHLPEGLKGRVYYRPKAAGYEATIRKLMEERDKSRKDRKP
ncbi:MAG TPA: replication-associated recombination protein A, partial [Planctomycetota bacterium]|nr:replication-associated recombination protein A [Planctomycetota bacterium]